MTGSPHQSAGPESGWGGISRPSPSLRPDNRQERRRTLGFIPRCGQEAGLALRVPGVWLARSPREGGAGAARAETGGAHTTPRAQEVRPWAAPHVQEWGGGSGAAPRVQERRASRRVEGWHSTLRNGVMGPRCERRKCGVTPRVPGGGLTPRAQELEGSRHIARAGSGGSPRPRRARKKGWVAPGSHEGTACASPHGPEEGGASRRACRGEGWPAHAVTRMLKPRCARGKGIACPSWTGMRSRVARAVGSAGPAYAGPWGSHSAACAGGVSRAARGRGRVDPGMRRKWGLAPRVPRGPTRSRTGGSLHIPRKQGLTPRVPGVTACKGRGLRAAGGGNPRA